MYFTEIFADFVFNIKAHSSKYRDFQNIHYIPAHSSKKCDLPDMFPNYYWVWNSYKQMPRNKIMALKEPEWSSCGLPFIKIRLTTLKTRM